MKVLSPLSKSAFKQTRAGKIPSDWNWTRLGEVFSHSRVRGFAGLPVLSVTIDKGIVSRDTIDRRMGPTLPPEVSLLVRKGDLAYNMMRMWQGAVGVSNVEGTVSPAYVVCRPKRESIDPRFMFYVFKSHRGLHKLLTHSHGITEDRLRLYFADFANIPVQLPPRAEQRKIADILTTWDEALEKLDALIAAQERRKKALMQQLLTGKRRFPGFTKEPWKKIRMSVLLKRAFRPINWSAHMSLSLVSLRRRSGGLFRRPDMLGADYKTQDLHELQAGDFLISKRQVAHGAWGLVTPEFAGTHVSKEYAILVNIAPARLFMPFFAWLCQTPRMIQSSRVASTGVHIEKLIFDAGVFLRSSIRIPASLEEQQHIVELLDAADEQLTHLHNQRNALEQQKRGLMQNLLTGKIRTTPHINDQSK